MVGGGAGPHPLPPMPPKEDTVSNVTIEKAVPDEDEIKLYDPVYAGYCFGPGGAGSTIDFGHRGGFEEHVWIGRRDHPLLNDLLIARPDLIEGDETTKITRVLVCPECNREFSALVAYKSHARTHKGGVSGMIEA